MVVASDTIDNDVRKEDALTLIKSEIDCGRPVIALGVVGPPEACIITGYKNNGNTLLGWSLYQDSQDDCEFDETGYFIKDNWWTSNYTQGIISIGDDIITPTSDLEVLENALKLMTTDEIAAYEGDVFFYSGQAAYEAWAAALEEDVYHDDMKYTDGQEGMLIERIYGAKYMELMAKRQPRSEKAFNECACLLKAAADYVPQMRKLREGQGLENLQTRRQIASLIRQAAQCEKNACEILRDIIQNNGKKDNDTATSEPMMNKRAYLKRGLALLNEGKLEAALQDYLSANRLNTDGKWSWGFEEALGVFGDKLTVAFNCLSTHTVDRASDIHVGVKEGDIIPFGMYQWRVLEIKDGFAFVVSELVVRRLPYARNVKNNNWECSDLRRYLNTEFYDTFTNEEKLCIVEVDVTDRDNPWHGTAFGNLTKDKIFLLSFDEVIRYFGDSGKINAGPVDDEMGIDDEFSKARTVKNNKGVDVFWWLRSPGGEGHTTGSIGMLCEIWICGDAAKNKSGGVRPAMWLKL